MQTTQPLRRTLATNWFPLFVLLFLILFPHLVGWMTNTSPLARRGLAVFWQGIAIELLIFAMLTMSYNLVFGFTGVISFGHALFFGLGGYIVGGMLRMDINPEIGLLLGVVLAFALCGVLGLLVGLVSLRLRGVYFAMFTLAVAEMVFLFFRSNPATGSEDGFALAVMPEWIDSTRNRLFFYYITVVAFVFMFLFIRRLMTSPTGAVLLAIRENEDRARAIGYNTLAYKLLAITVAGVLASAAGVLFTLLNKKVGPEMLSVTYTVDPLLMTIVGGIGTFSGPVIGGAGLRLVDRLLREATITIGGTVIDIGPSWPMILGTIFVLVVIVFPHGIVGTFNRWRARLRTPTTPAAPKQQSAPAGD